MNDFIKDRVLRGAALLDSVKPGWEDKINLDVLDVSNIYYCVLGQLALVERFGKLPEPHYSIRGGRYVYATPQPNYTAVNWYDVYEELCKHEPRLDGNGVSFGFSGSQKVTDAWIELIKARRPAKAVPTKKEHVLAA